MINYDVCGWNSRAHMRIANTIHTVFSYFVYHIFCDFILLYIFYKRHDNISAFLWLSLIFSNVVHCVVLEQWNRNIFRFIFVACRFDFLLVLSTTLYLNSIILIVIRIIHSVNKVPGIIHLISSLSVICHFVWFWHSIISVNLSCTLPVFCNFYHG